MIPALVALFISASEPQPARIKILVHPEDCHIYVNGYQIQSRGSSRLVETPALDPGKKYVYEIVARHNGKTVTKTVEVQAGSEAEVAFDLTINHGIQNFGVVVDRLMPERIKINGRSVSEDELTRLLQLQDDSHKLRLTIIGTKQARERVLNDIRTTLADLSRDFLIQDYAPDHWAVSRVGFVAPGDPTIYIQAPDGKVLHRQDDYNDGADGLRQAMLAARKRDPNYNPQKDHDLRKTTGGAHLLVLAAAGLLIMLAIRRR